MVEVEQINFHQLNESRDFVLTFSSAAISLAAAAALEWKWKINKNMKIFLNHLIFYIATLKRFSSFGLIRPLPQLGIYIFSNLPPHRLCCAFPTNRGKV